MYSKLHDTAQGFTASQQGHSPSHFAARKKDRARLRGRAPQVHDCIVSSARRHPRCAQASACLSAARRYDGRLPVHRRRVADLEVRHWAGPSRPAASPSLWHCSCSRTWSTTCGSRSHRLARARRAAARLEHACQEPAHVRRAADAAIAHCPAGLTEAPRRARQDFQQCEDGLM